MNSLKNHLTNTSPGKISDPSGLDQLLADCWEEFHGSREGGMEADKLLGRIEDAPQEQVRNPNEPVVQKTTAGLPVLMQTQAIRTCEINRCGSCDACCTALGIVDDQLTKMEGVPCEHLCASGCGIYKTRPSVCRLFECQWLQLGGCEKYRPDNSGLLCFLQRFHPAIGVAVQVTELFMRAADSPVGRDWIAKLRDHQFTTVFGERIRLPICVVRFRQEFEISRRPTRWLVSRKDLAALEYLRNQQERDRFTFGTSPNAPCRCGSGIKFKKCHAKSLEIVITE